MTEFQYRYKAECTAVYDGDTITVDIDLGFKVWMYGVKIRLFGIDAPEMRGPEKAAGTITRDALRNLILYKSIEVHSIRDKTGKYGRWLANIHIEKNGELMNVNEWLVKRELAEPRDYG